jgi:hypothetical protein
MADESSTPAVPPAAPAATPAPPPAPPPAEPPALPNVGEPGWLKARTDKAKEEGKKESRKELKADRKAAKAAAKEAVSAKAVADAEVAAANRAADAILAQVPEAERKTLLEQSGGSAAKKLELFAAWQLAKMGAAPAPAHSPAVPPAQAAPPAQHAAPAAPPPLAAPATSAAPPAAPPPPTPGAPEDHRAKYEQLKATNPYLAAEYLLNHQYEIYKPRTFDQVPKRT